MVASNYVSRYLLPSDEAESERLGIQHAMLKKQLGDILFAPLTLGSGDAVLDSGTGTGCWIMDCYDTFETASVHYYGVDISSRLFPILDEHVASKVHFCEGNMLAPQGEWAERSYKLVNQRLLVAALSADEWKTVIDNIYDLLQPGGWVQLLEASYCYSGEATERHRMLLKRIFEKRGVLIDPARNISALLQDRGFVAVHIKDYDVSLGKWAGKDGEAVRESCIGVFRGMKHPVVNVMHLLSASEYDLLIDQMEEEWDDIQGSKVRYNVLYAQKPEST